MNTPDESGMGNRDSLYERLGIQTLLQRDSPSDKPYRMEDFEGGRHFVQQSDPSKIIDQTGGNVRIIDGSFSNVPDRGNESDMPFWSDEWRNKSTFIPHQTPSENEGD